MENDLIELPFIGPNGVFPSSGSYVISYSHDSIHIEFYGIVGALSVQRAGVSSSIVGFRQLSPSIIGDGSRRLYMKSDQVVGEQEAIYYDSKRLWKSTISMPCFRSKKLYLSAHFLTL